MVKRITFRVPCEMLEELKKVEMELNKAGLDLDDSKVIRFILNKGMEKLKLEGFIK